VNEANLTGESIPIGKFALEKFSHYRRDDTSKWIYEGSKILSAQNALAIAMHTGYTSKRGRILRKILNRSPATPHFFTTCMYFLVFNYLVGIIVYLATLPVRISNGNLDPIIIFLDFLLVVTFCMPPSSPIYFNLVYSACLVRLKWK
jgi:magnesium-transporting ATPase (P-type)